MSPRRTVRTRVVTGLGALVVTASMAGCSAVAGVSAAPAATVGGSVANARAQAIAAQVIDSATKASAAPGADGDAARTAAHTGDALVAAQAEAKLAGTLSQEQKDALALTATAPTVLAVSRGLDYPRQMVVQTTRAKTGLPVLYLLTTPDARTPFRIAASGTMLSGAQVPAFDQISIGSPALGDGSGIAVDPSTLAAAYAASLAYPAPAASADAPFTADDALAKAIRGNANAVSQALGSVATFTQQQSAKDVPGGLRLAGGQGALAFAVLNRTDTVLRKTAGTINATPQFTTLTGQTTINAEATQEALEFVVFVIPQSGAATVVAGQDQLVGASGT